MSKIVRVNMIDLTAEFKYVPNKFELMGECWLTSSIVCEEVPPICHPLGPNNKVVFATGIVPGTFKAGN